MTLPPLTIVPAGAGSGKTYMIQDQLGRWVEEGKIAPERIVAVTFTEAAAAELRERIRQKLLGLGRLEDALKLDQAYITTIHGFGLRLLKEFSFDAGLSPQPRLLNEDEENTLIRLALARTDKIDVITSNLTQYGYNFDYNTQKSPEDVFRDVLLDVISLLRSIGWQEENSDCVEAATSWIKQKYGPTSNGDKLTEHLKAAVINLLRQFPESLASEYGTNATALKALQNDFRNLRKAKDSDALLDDWNLWKDLRSLRQSKRGSPLPDGYDELADGVINAASVLPSHPGPLAQANTHIEALLEAGQDVLAHYAEAKREAGLVDYSDMIAMAGDVLRNQPGVLDTFANSIDCLVVDEFQDTNPLQFSLLWQLKEAGVPTVIVGDLKQAIMGFQGADPRLFDALIQQNPEHSKALDRNWRSQPRLMEFINSVGPGLFGDAYDSLAPQAAGSKLDPLEVIHYPASARKDFHLIRAASLGQRLQALMEGTEQVILDKRTKQFRHIRGGDIAVLCPTHPMLAKYASVLRSQGLRVCLQEDGWFTSRAVQIALHALAYLANPADRHAALYLAVTELGSSNLKEALRQLMEEGEIDEPLLKKLKCLAPGVADRTVYALVTDMLSVLGLFDEISVWPDGQQARANLLRLQSEAGDFMEANREALASGGFHGSGIQSFLAWLDVRIEQNKGDNQPNPRVIDEDAIELVTWHSSKGREWPVVAVCGLGRTIPVSLPDMSLGYSSFDDLSQLINNTQVEFSQKFAAPETNDKFLAVLKEEAETENRRLLYVAMTRPKEKLILEWPSYLAGKDKFTYWSILSEESGLELNDDELKIGENEFPCIVTEGDSELSADMDIDSRLVDEILPITGRRAIQPGTIKTTLTPDSVTPSGIDTSDLERGDSKIELIQYSDGLDIDIHISGTELGTYLHRCFELLGSNPGLVDRLPEITGIDVEVKLLKEISTGVASFESWMEQYFSAISVSRELPLLAVNKHGSVISGLADLVIETEKGVWIIDHKSDIVSDVEAAFNHYRPQLDLYSRSLASTGRNVLGTGINWIRGGVVVFCNLL